MHHISSLRASTPHSFETRAWVALLAAGPGTQRAYPSVCHPDRPPGTLIRVSSRPERPHFFHPSAAADGWADAEWRDLLSVASAGFRFISFTGLPQSAAKSSHVGF